MVTVRSLKRDFFFFLISLNETTKHCQRRISFGFFVVCVFSDSKSYISLVNFAISLRRTGFVFKSYKKLLGQKRDKFKQSKPALVALSCSQVNMFMHMYVCLSKGAKVAVLICCFNSRKLLFYPRAIFLLSKAKHT